MCNNDVANGGNGGIAYHVAYHVWLWLNDALGLRKPTWLA